MLILTASVFLVTRYRLSAASPASAQEASRAGWAETVRREAHDLLPATVLGTATGAMPEDSGGGPPEVEGGPGFISTGLIAEADPSLLPWDEPQRYIVQDGDTISGIAGAFGIEAETLLYANPDLRENPHFLSVGQEVTILPVNGVLHVVAEGDTLDSIAEEYKAEAVDILSYTPNGLRAGDALVVGTQVVVPGGEMDIVIPSYYQIVQGSSSRSVWASDGGQGPVAGSGSFYKATYGRISQWYSRWHRGVDIANSTGTPVYAVDGGTIEVAGWYGWAGNAVIIDHGNGFESLYAHLSTVGVAPGQTVQRGQVVGAIGCTRGYGGRCTGPHLHLELYYQGGNVNPCAYGVCP